VSEAGAKQPLGLRAADLANHHALFELSGAEDRRLRLVDDDSPRPVLNPDHDTHIDQQVGQLLLGMELARHQFQITHVPMMIGRGDRACSRD
jgi:hypothetical protein